MPGRYYCGAGAGFRALAASYSSSGPMSCATLLRAQVAARDLGDLRVALALELAQHEHRAMMRRQPAHALLHGVPQVSLAVQVVGPRRAVLELQRPLVCVPALLDRLEQHERVAAAVAQL